MSVHMMSVHSKGAFKAFITDIDSACMVCDEDSLGVRP